MKTIGNIILGYLTAIAAFIIFFIVISLCAAFAGWDWRMFKEMTDVLTSSFGIRFALILITVVYSIVLIIIKYAKNDNVSN